MADSQIAVTPGSGANVRTVTNAAVDSGAHQQVATLADSLGNVNPAFPDGSQTVDTGSRNLFTDPFDTAPASSGYWLVTGSASGSNGQAVLALATTVSAATYLVSNPATFGLLHSYLKVGFGVLHEATATTNNARWWGLGIMAGTPTAAAPITNGVVFMLDPTTGGLLGAAYSAGVRTQTVPLTRQSDAAMHRYQIYFNKSRAYFEIDGVAVGSLAWPGLVQSSGLKLLAGSFNSTSVASQATTFTLGYASVADAGQNATAIMGGDLTTGYIRASVRAGAVSAASSDNALVVGLHPTTPLPAGNNSIGSVNVAGIVESSASGTITVTDTLAGTPAGTGALISTNASGGSSVVWSAVSGVGPAYSTIDIQVTGTFGGGTIYFEGSVDSANWFPLTVVQQGLLSPAPGYSTTTAGVFRGSPAGLLGVRARIVGATSPSVAVSFRVSHGQSVTGINFAPGGTAFTLVSAASTNATAVRTTPTTLYELTVANPTATAAYVKLYNKSSAPTVGTDVPVVTWRVAATASAGDTLNLSFGELGKRFPAGLALAITAAAVATDTAVAVAGVQVSGTTA